MTRIDLFPGQGSQKVGMGAELFPLFPQQVAQADEILGYSIEELCLRDPAGQLNQTRYTQPALFVVSALQFLQRVTASGCLPRFVAGHSLGEYSALFAAGVFDFGTGVRIVRERAALMAEAKGGGMLAVIGLKEPEVRRVLEEGGHGGIDLANLNAPTQIVVSGPVESLPAAQASFEAAGAQMVVRLPVSAAFHSRYMAGAGHAFGRYLEPIPFRAPSIPVLSNVTARPHEPAAIKDLLARQITHSVRWTECIHWLLAQPEPEWSEVGPGNVLTGLLRRIRSAL